MLQRPARCFAHHRSCCRWRDSEIADPFRAGMAIGGRESTGIEAVTKRMLWQRKHDGWSPKNGTEVYPVP